MNRLTLIAAILFFQITAAFSAGIYENENQSAEFIRTLNRSASTDIDAAYFNPAGLVFLKPGTTLYFSNQYINDYRTVRDSSTIVTKTAGKSLDSQDYDGKAETYIYPDIFVAYRRGDFALYSTFNVIGSGASAFFDNGLPVLDKATVIVATLHEDIGLFNYDKITDFKTESTIKGLSYFLSATAGGAYSINRIFSISFGLRYIYDIEDYNASVKWKSVKNADHVNLVEKSPDHFSDIEVHAKGKGSSYGAIAGLNIKPCEKMNIGMRFEYYSVMETKIRLEKLQVPSNLIELANSVPEGKKILGDLNGDGIGMKRTLPPNFSIGVSYQVLSDLKLETSFIYYFNRLADWGYDPISSATGDKRKESDKYDNGFGAGLAAEYDILSNLKWSAGFTYTRSGRRAESTNEMFFNLDTVSVGTGFTYVFSDVTQFTLGAMRVFHKSYIYDNELLKAGGNAVKENGQQRVTERTWVVAMGITHRI